MILNHLAKPIDPKKLHNILEAIANPQPTTAPRYNDTMNTDNKDNNESHNQKTNNQPSSTPQKQTPQLIGVKTLDDELLNGLKQGLGEKETQSLIHDLLKKSDEIIEQMGEAFDKKRKADLLMRAHEMKGMCANFGLKAVSEKAGEIETLMRKDDPDIDHMDAHIADLTTLLERSKIALNEFIEL